MLNEIILQAKKFEAQGDLQSALQILKKTHESHPDDLVITLELGNLCATHQLFNEAVAYFRECYVATHNNPEIKDALCFCLTELGNAYQSKRQFLLSEACFNEIIQYEKNNWVYYYNLANALCRQQKNVKAYSYYQKALTLNDQDADLWNNLGNLQRTLGELDKAIISYRRALSINPQLFHAELHLTHQKQHMCDWDGIDALFQKMCTLVNTHSEALISPFAFLSNPFASGEDQLKCATQWTQNHFQDALNKKEKKSKRRNKIRIGYLSSDFKLHPLYFLIRDIIKYHDRNFFDIYAYDASPHEDTLERNTLVDLFDRHRDISQIDDKEVISLINQDQIDILIDLTGYTHNSRAFIAPQLKNTVTINWLGYPGSMGFTHTKALYDYILADDFIIPKHDEQYYAESILRLPFAYQPNLEDRGEQLNQKSRSEYGIPEHAFVYCAFNQSFKLTEIIFKAWLRLLKNHPESVLWLTDSNRWATQHLRNYASQQGIDLKRIIFAARVPNNEHMARHALADLYLDTLPYNGHTSASDALSMNVPIVTMTGKTFASRVAGSLLHSLGLDELITHDIESYIACASKITQDTSYKKALVKKLKLAKRTSPVFNPQLFVKELEIIYQKLI